MPQGSLRKALAKTATNTGDEALIILTSPDAKKMCQFLKIITK